MKKVFIALVAATVTLSVSGCNSKAPEECVAALDKADEVFQSTGKAAKAVAEGDHTTYNDSVSDMRVGMKMYRDLSKQCRDKS